MTSVCSRVVFCYQDNPIAFFLGTLVICITLFHTFQHDEFLMKISGVIMLLLLVGLASASKSSFLSVLFFVASCAFLSSIFRKKLHIFIASFSIQITYFFVAGIPLSFLQFFISEMTKEFPNLVRASVQGVVEGKFESDTAFWIVQEIIKRFS